MGEYGQHIGTKNVARFFLFHILASVSVGVSIHLCGGGGSDYSHERLEMLGLLKYCPIDFYHP